MTTNQIGHSNHEPHDASPLRGIVRVVSRWRWIVLSALLVALLAGVGYTLVQGERHLATAQVLLSDDAERLVADVTGVEARPSSNPERESATQAVLARTPGVVNRVLERPAAEGVSASQILANSSVSGSVDTSILSFTYTSSNPEQARRLATEYARQYTVFRRSLDTAAVRNARLAVDERLAELEAAGETQGEGTQGAQGGQDREAIFASLVDSQQQLATIEALQSSNTSLVQPAARSSQVQPRPLRNVAIGLLVGLVIGVGGAFLREALDMRFRTANDIARALGVPIVGNLPEPARQLREEDRLVMLDQPHSPAAEAFRMLRTNLEFVAVDRGVRTLLVTSASESEGKSTTSANLALAAARAGRRVALVELDLRRPYLARFFPVKGARGLTDVVLGSASLDEALFPVVVAPAEPVGGEGAIASENGHVPTEGNNVFILLAGTLPPNPGELAGSPAVRRVLEALVERFDLVVIDSPPMLAVGDAMSISAGVDSILVVARLDRARRPAITELRRLLESSPAPTLGVAITGVTAGDGYYDSYAYGGGYGSTGASQEAAAREAR